MKKADLFMGGIQTDLLSEAETLWENMLVLRTRFIYLN